MALPTPWAAWKCSDGSGLVLADDVGSRPLTAGSPIDWVTGHDGEAGGAAYFDPSESAVWNGSIGAGFSACTIECWYKPTNLGAGDTDCVAGFFAGGFGSSTRFAIWAQRGDFGTPNLLVGQFRGGGLEGVYDTTALTNDVWVHLALTWDGATVRLYRDGTEVANQAFTDAGPLWSDAAAFGVGQSPDASRAVQDLRVFNVALTAAQVTEAMNTPVGAIPVLTAEYGFADNTGTDSSGNGRMLTATGSPSVAGGHTGNGAIGGATNRFRGQLGPNLATSNWTVMCWVKVNSASVWSTILSNSSSFYLGVRPEGRYDLFAGTVTLAMDGSVPHGSWYHLAVTCSGGAIRLWINGRQVSAPGTANPVNFGSGTWEIGSYNDGGTSPLDGIVDDLRVFLAPLTAAEIRAWRDAPAGSGTPTVSNSHATPISAYAFDEGSGTTTADATGNGRTLTGGAWATGHTGSGAGGGWWNGPWGPDVTQQVYTIMCWLKIDSVPADNYRQFVYSTAGNLWFQIQGNSDGTKYRVMFFTGGGQHQTDYVYDVGTWHHFAAIRQDGLGSMYVDGAYVVGGPVGALNFGHLGDAYSVGSQTSSGAINGAIDDLRFFDVAIIDEDFAYWMNTPVGSTTVTGTVGGQIPKVTGSTTGAVITSGTLSAQIPGVTASVTETSTGVISGQIPKVTGSVVGTLITQGTLGAAVPVVTGSVSGSVAEFSGISATVPGITAAISGQVLTTGAVSGQLPLVSASVGGTVVTVTTGVVQAVLLKVTGLVPGLVMVIGAVDGDIPRITSHISHSDHSGDAPPPLIVITRRRRGSQPFIRLSRSRREP